MPSTEAEERRRRAVLRDKHTAELEKLEIKLALAAGESKSRAKSYPDAVQAAQKRTGLKQKHANENAQLESTRHALTD